MWNIERSKAVVWVYAQSENSAVSVHVVCAAPRDVRRDVPLLFTLDLPDCNVLDQLDP